jgi:hypothetical protein
LDRSEEIEELLKAAGRVREATLIEIDVQRDLPGGHAPLLAPLWIWQREPKLAFGCG